MAKDHLLARTSLPLWHPMTVPLLFAEFQRENSCRVLLDVLEDLGQIEYLSGQHDWEYDVQQGHADRVDYHQMTGNLTSNNVRLAHHENVCSYVIALNDFIEQNLIAIKPSGLGSDQANVDWELQMLFDHNPYLKNWTQCLSKQFDDLRKRTQGMTQAVR